MQRNTQRVAASTRKTTATRRVKDQQLMKIVLIMRIKMKILQMRSLFDF